MIKGSKGGWGRDTGWPVLQAGLGEEAVLVEMSYPEGQSQEFFDRGRGESSQLGNIGIVTQSSCIFSRLNPRLLHVLPGNLV